MEFLASTWWVWFGILCVAFGYAVFYQVRRTKRIFNGMKEGDVNAIVSSLPLGISSMMICGIIGFFAFVLFVTSIAINLFGK